MSAVASTLPLASPLATRVLQLHGFSTEIRTRDLHTILRPWENLAGGYRIRWQDDNTAYVVFSDAGVAKRAYLELLAAPPPLLRCDYKELDSVPDTAARGMRGARLVDGAYAAVTPCTGTKAGSIIASVAQPGAPGSHRVASGVNMAGGGNGKAPGTLFDTLGTHGHAPVTGDAPSVGLATPSPINTHRRVPSGAAQPGRRIGSP